MDLFSAMILGCMLDANDIPAMCETLAFPRYVYSMEECLDVLIEGIVAVNNSGVYTVVDYRCIAWGQTEKEDEPYNERDL
jgi:hypothetical protein